MSSWDRFVDTFLNGKVMLKYLPDILSGVVVTIELALLIVGQVLVEDLCLRRRLRAGRRTQPLRPVAQGPVFGVFWAVAHCSSPSIQSANPACDERLHVGQDARLALCPLDANRRATVSFGVERVRLE